jgi:hypothetical protein
MRESTIERKVVAFCKRNGVYTRKFVSPAHKGVPDRIFICNGTTLFLEFKAPGKKPTPLQSREMTLIHGHGVPAVCVDSYDIAKFILKRMLNLPSDAK